MGQLPILTKIDGAVRCFVELCFGNLGHASIATLWECCPEFFLVSRSERTRGPNLGSRWDHGRVAVHVLCTSGKATE